MLSMLISKLRTAVTWLLGWFSRHAGGIFDTVSEGMRRARTGRRGSAGEPLHSRHRIPVPPLKEKFLSFVPNGSRTFDPSLNPALSELQRNAVRALFRRLKQEWVPPEYFDFLNKHPSPVRALEEFCKYFLIDPRRLGREEPEVLEAFDTLASQLIEIDDLRELLDPTQLTDFAMLRPRIEPEQFEQSLKALREFGSLKRLAARLCEKRDYPIFRRYFDDAFFEDDLHSVDARRIEHCGAILKWLEHCDASVEEIDTALRGARYPNKKLQDLAAELRGRLEHDLKTTEDGETFLRQINEHRQVIYEFLEEIASVKEEYDRAEHGKRSRSGEESRTAGSSEMNCAEAFKELDMIDLPSRTLAMARKKWRELAKKYHPDLVGDRDDATLSSFEEKMKSINVAYDFLKNNLSCFST